MRARMRSVSLLMALLGGLIMLWLPGNLLAADSHGHGSDPGPADLDQVQAEKARQIKSELMAPCCWNGTVDRHASAKAKLVAHRVEHWVAEGKNKDEILNTLAAEYGERILASPRQTGFGLVFYAGPALFALVTGFLIWGWLKRNVRASNDEPTQAVASSPPLSDRPDLEAKFEEQLRAQD